MSDVPLRFAEWEKEVCGVVCDYYDDPLGYCPTEDEVFDSVPDIDGKRVRLAGLVAGGYLESERIGKHGFQYTPTDLARRQFPDRYPPPIGTAKPFAVELVEWEAWKASGEIGPCPMCKARKGEMHGRKYCFGMSGGVVGQGET